MGPLLRRAGVPCDSPLPVPAARVGLGFGLGARSLLCLSACPPRRQCAPRPARHESYTCACTYMHMHMRMDMHMHMHMLHVHAHAHVHVPASLQAYTAS
jgi:hypothetical protein